MSMTREEAIERYEGIRYTVACFTGSKKDCDAVDMAFSALRPVSREWVEKVWRGEWIHKRSPYDYKIYVCKNCRKQISIQGGPLIFCPSCGAAQTDEAVEMVMERMERVESNEA